MQRPGKSSNLLVELRYCESRPPSFIDGLADNVILSWGCLFQAVVQYAIKSEGE
jgi:hypothetical protein